jgi:hypothetical protein
MDNPTPATAEPRLLAEERLIDAIRRQNRIRAKVVVIRDRLAREAEEAYRRGSATPPFTVNLSEKCS